MGKSEVGSLNFIHMESKRAIGPFCSYSFTAPAMMPAKINFWNMR